MRFHTAATFLAQSLLPLAELSNSLSTESSKDRKKKLDDRDIKILQQPWSSFAVNKQQDEVEEGSINKSKPLLKAFQKNLRDIIKDKIRAPEQPEDTEDLKECSMMENDLDSALGLIGDCGPDEKCVESELSKTGGVCLKMTATIDADKRRRRMQYGSCTYDNFDPATATGEITCVYGELCFSDTYCVIPTVIRTFDGGEQYESYTTCFEVTVGSDNEICYGYSYDTLPDCFVEANGERCNSCLLYLCPSSETGQDSTPGAEFDCTNTVLGTAGNQCEGYSFLPGLNEPPAEPTTGAPTSTPAPTAPETLPPTDAPSVPTTPAPVTSAPVTAAPVTGAPVSTSAPVPPAPTVSNNPPTTTSAASTKTRTLVSAVTVVVGVAAVVMA